MLIGKTSLLVLALALVACGSTSPADPVPCPTQDASPEPLPPDASTPPLDAGADTGDSAVEPCALSVDSIDPVSVFYGQAHNTLVVAKGCGFLKVRDVEVNVGSVPFRAIDDHTLVFLASAEVLDTNSIYEFPMKVQVDIIRIQPDQVQTFLTWAKQ